jgi:arsenate reductase-like glutaredoxin family protein
MLKLYGIPNCDTVKKSRARLDELKLDHSFHDFKKQGVPADRLDAWIAALG